IQRDGRVWIEVINREVLVNVPLFQGASPTCLHSLAMMLKPIVFPAGEHIIRKGEMGSEMYFICRGQVEVLDGAGKRVAVLGEGDFFGELALLLSQPRNASIRALTMCDLFVLDKADFNHVLKDYPEFAGSLREVVKKRYASVEGK